MTIDLANFTPWASLAGGVLLCLMGLVSIWAFINPANANAPANALPAVSQIVSAASPLC